MQSLFEAKQPNDYYELMELGIRAVHQTLARYAKMQTGPIALEERYLFSEWLEFAKKLSLVIKVPIIELAEEHDLTETECVFILCLYAFHTSPFIRDACVAIRGDDRLCGFTPNKCKNYINGEKDPDGGKFRDDNGTKIGIHIHSAPDDETSSEGCQNIPISLYASFLKEIENSNNRTDILYTLIDASKIATLEAQ